MRKFIMMLIVIFSMMGVVLAQQVLEVQKEDTKIYANFPINISINQMQPDGVGTDVENIYTIKVDYQSDKFRNKNTYTIMSYLDSVPVDGFKSQNLPFEFTRNYKAHADGPHEIKINVEDGHGHVLATSSLTITVKHQGKQLK